MNRYYNPVRTLEGPGCLRQLPQVLEEMTLPQRKVLVLAWSQQALEHPAVAGERRGSKKSGVYGLQPHRGAAVSGVAGDNGFCPRGGGSHWGRQCAGCRQVPVLLVRSGVGKSPGIAGGHHRWKITSRRPVDRRAHHSGYRKRGHLLGHHLGSGAKLQALFGEPGKLRLRRLGRPGVGPGDARAVGGVLCLGCCRPCGGELLGQPHQCCVVS